MCANEETLGAHEEFPGKGRVKRVQAHYCVTAAACLSKCQKVTTKWRGQCLLYAPFQYTGSRKSVDSSANSARSGMQSQRGQESGPGFGGGGISGEWGSSVSCLSRNHVSKPFVQLVCLLCCTACDPSKCGRACRRRIGACKSRVREHPAGRSTHAQQQGHGEKAHIMATMDVV